MERRDFARAARFFPKAWRARYGKELEALLEDTYGPGGRVPVWSRVLLLRTAAVEHMHDMGLVGSPSGSVERSRAGTLAVLWAGAIFLIAGAGFGNASEGWRTGPLKGAALASVGYYLVLGAAVVGAGLVLAGAMLFFGPLVRSLRKGAWREFRRHAACSLGFSLFSVAVLAAMVAWAERLTKAQRDGGYWPFELLALLLAMAVSATVVSWTAWVVTCLRRLELPPETWRAAGELAIAVCGAMLVMAAGAGLWWASAASRAPAVIGGGAAGSLLLDSAGALLVAGSLLAVVGAVRASPKRVRVGTRT